MRPKNINANIQEELHKLKITLVQEKVSGNVGGILTRLQVAQSLVRILAEPRYFSLLQIIHLDSGVHSATYAMGIGVLSWGYRTRG
jgi:hypothetical protein